METPAHLQANSEVLARLPAVERIWLIEGPDAEGQAAQLDTLAAEFTSVDQTRLWTKVLDRLEAGDMPPKDAQQPPPVEREQAAAWINDRLLEADRRTQMLGIC